jgi:hypothetical protein
VLCPLQLYEKSALKANLITILHEVRTPDMSMPLNVSGVALEEALIPTESEDQKRFRALRTLQVTKKAAEVAAQTHQPTLTDKLVHFDTSGDQIFDNTDYWAQKSSNALHSGMDSATMDVTMRNTTVSNIEVVNYEVAPDYKVSSQGALRRDVF